MIYWDSAVHRMRDSKGRFRSSEPTPDEVCPNGCERFGDWWIPTDCATHLVGTS